MRPESLNPKKPEREFAARLPKAGLVTGSMERKTSLRPAAPAPTSEEGLERGRPSSIGPIISAIVNETDPNEHISENKSTHGTNKKRSIFQLLKPRDAFLYKELLDKPVALRKKPVF